MLCRSTNSPIRWTEFTTLHFTHSSYNKINKKKISLTSKILFVMKWNYLALLSKCSSYISIKVVQKFSNFYQSHTTLLMMNYNVLEGKWRTEEKGIGRDGGGSNQNLALVELLGKPKKDKLNLQRNQNFCQPLCRHKKE